MTVSLPNNTDDQFTITFNHDTHLTSQYTLDTTAYSGSTVTIDLPDLNELDTDYVSVQPARPFIDEMPSLSKINSMCNEYPGLEKAYENFKTAYKLVEQDYKGKQQAGEIDDDIPF